ncbi:hypothetical protein X928_07030 [Petrotoga miotherma DSM 10691]|uniref:Transposase IS4-like domain-containing protein n=1 Tax=Petrotoga miotherma DSM 10691 TaxID=1434326 RepID=A0A2K1P9U8_9BACT|nr:hypothetical protein [Petrotoga miotherma]PNR99574.1 hypothetical protein X928_07030 [Petrotoga miotherma DSM 10691]
MDKIITFTVLKGIKEGINVPIFTVVSPACAHDKNYALVLLEKVVKYLDLSGFNFLADAAYDSSDLYDYVHLKAGSIAFIPLPVLLHDTRLFNPLFMFNFFNLHFLGENCIFILPFLILFLLFLLNF